MLAVKLISDITVRPVQSMGGDYMVVAAARVSTSGAEAMKYANAEAGNENAGLIRYLMKMRHGTPFEHSAMTFFVHAPIFVFREWHRHRIGHSYNEESARYKPLDPVFWVARRDRPMCPVKDWKPGYPKFMTLDQYWAGKLDLPAESPEANSRANNAYIRYRNRNERSYEMAYTLYQEDIQEGIALEVARSKLPVGIYSSCWVTVNPRSLMAFLSLRTHDPEANHVSYPQAEIEEAARVCEEIFKTNWPITYQAWDDFGREGP